MKALKDTRILGMPLAFYLVLTVATLFISIRGNLLDNMISHRLLPCRSARALA